MTLLDRLASMWNDQVELNKLFRPDGPPTEYKDKVALTKEIILHIHSEADELLRALGAWKPHRRQVMPENRANILNELADMHRYLLTLYEIWGVTPDEAVDSFQKKGMVVRQRHAEEFVHSLDSGPIAVVDIDNVLADYIAGFKAYLVGQGFDLSTVEPLHWISAETLGLDREDYNRILHDFRVTGGMANLRPMPGAQDFLFRLSDRGYIIVLLTARPIHEYPTLYTDTLMWLHHYHMPFHYIWWARDKGERIQDKGLPARTKLIIDDDERYIEQYSRLKLDAKIFWFLTGDYLKMTRIFPYPVIPITSLGHVESFLS